MNMLKRGQGNALPLRCALIRLYDFLAPHRMCLLVATQATGQAQAEVMVYRRDEGNQDADVISGHGFGMAHVIVTMTLRAGTDTHKIITEAQFALALLEENDLPWLGL